MTTSSSYRITFVYAPHGEGFRGKYDFGGGSSICRHVHKTGNAAESCAKKTRAKFNRGEIKK
jgi:hypothetical protein